MAWKRLIVLFFLLSSNLEAQEFKLKKIIGLNEPWGSTFVNKNEILITEKSGKIKLFNLVNKKTSVINHNLNVIEYGQGGLLDIIFKDGFVWVSYTEQI